MIESNAKAELRLMRSKEGETVSLEVNWDKEHLDCVKVGIAGKEAIIKKRDLMLTLFQIGDEDMQEQLMPSKQIEMRRYKRQHVVKVQKDLKKGEDLIVNCNVDVPAIVEEGLKNEKLGLQDKDGRV